HRYGNSRIREAHGDAAAHRAGADHGGFPDLARLHVRREARNLRRLALGAEQMPLRLRLVALHEAEKGLALLLERGIERDVQRPAYGLDRRARRIECGAALREFRRDLIELRGIVAEGLELLVEIAHPAARPAFG